MKGRFRVTEPIDENCLLDVFAVVARYLATWKVRLSACCRVYLQCVNGSREFAKAEDEAGPEKFIGLHPLFHSTTSPASLPPQCLIRALTHVHTTSRRLAFNLEKECMLRLFNGELIIVSMEVLGSACCLLWSKSHSLFVRAAALETSQDYQPRDRDACRILFSSL